MEGSETPQAEKFRFVGPIKDPQTVAGAKEYLETTKPDLPPEIKTEDRLKEAAGLQEVFLEYGKSELGIDLSKRIPPLENFHFFDKQGYQKVRDKYNRSSGSVAVHSTSGHIMVQQADTETETLSNANHELVHLMSYRSINLCQVDGQTLTKREHSGYANENTRALAQLDEALTEITNIDIMTNHWKQNDKLKNMDFLKNPNVGYIEHVIVVDELIKKISREQGKPYKDVLRQLQRGKFLGEFQALRIITDSIGPESMALIASLDMSLDKTLQLAENLGLEEARQKIEALNKGWEVKILNNIAPDLTYRGNPTLTKN